MTTIPTRKDVEIRKFVQKEKVLPVIFIVLYFNNKIK